MTNLRKNSICLGFNGAKIYPVRWFLTICICILVVVSNSLPAFAVVMQIEEYSGQMLYQIRQTISDQTGKSWQVIIFKRIHPEGSATVSLRLIGFPGAVELNHSQPLALTTSLGLTLKAKDISNEISQNTPPLANVGEYDIKSVLSQLQIEIPLKLTLPTSSGKSIILSIPPSLIEEWKTFVN